MTFKEWWDKEGLHFSNYETIEDVASRAWTAALATKKEVSVGFNPIHGDWYVFSEDLADDVSVGHYSKRSALEWAHNNGYKVTNNF